MKNCYTYVHMKNNNLENICHTSLSEDISVLYSFTVLIYLFYLFSSSDQIAQQEITNET